MKFLNRLGIAAVVLLSGSICIHAQEDLNGSPLEEITHDMKVAADHLAKKTTDKPTQRSQDEAVSKLDLLIAELEKERSSMGSGTSPSPTRPANASNVRKGPGGMGDLHGARMQGDRWGELPPHERDRILQSLTEGFPPHYQAVLEAYYKRLAVEKRAEEPESAVEPKSDAKTGNSKPVSVAPAKSPMPAKKVAK